MLTIADLYKHFAGLAALDAVKMEVEEGTVHAVLEDAQLRQQYLAL